MPGDFQFVAEGGETNERTDTAKKQAVVEEIKAAIEQAQSVTIVAYNGITVEGITELRNQFRAEDVVYKVYKNTMVRRAFNDLGVTDLDDLLNGPNAFIFSNKEMVDGPKIAAKFAQDNKEKFKILGGYMDGHAMSGEEMIALSKLPTKEVLLSMVLRGLQGPISGLANASQGILRKAVYAFNAIKEKKEEEAA